MIFLLLAALFTCCLSGIALDAAAAAVILETWFGTAQEVDRAPADDTLVVEGIAAIAAAQRIGYLAVNPAGEGSAALLPALAVLDRVGREWPVQTIVGV